MPCRAPGEGSRRVGERGEGGRRVGGWERREGGRSEGRGRGKRRRREEKAEEAAGREEGGAPLGAARGGAGGAGGGAGAAETCPAPRGGPEPGRALGSRKREVAEWLRTSKGSVKFCFPRWPAPLAHACPGRLGASRGRARGSERKSELRPRKQGGWRRSRQSPRPVQICSCRVSFPGLRLECGRAVLFCRKQRSRVPLGCSAPIGKAGAWWSRGSVRLSRFLNLPLKGSPFWKWVLHVCGPRVGNLQRMLRGEGRAQSSRPKVRVSRSEPPCAMRVFVPGAPPSQTSSEWWGEGLGLHEGGAACLSQKSRWSPGKPQPPSADYLKMVQTPCLPCLCPVSCRGHLLRNFSLNSDVYCICSPFLPVILCSQAQVTSSSFCFCLIWLDVSPYSLTLQSPSGLWTSHRRQCWEPNSGDGLGLNLSSTTN